MLRPLKHHGKTPLYPLDTPHSWFGHSGGEKILSLLMIRPKFSGCPAQMIIIILTEHTHTVSLSTYNYTTIVIYIENNYIKCR
jgi:hypothetical protein